MSNTFVEYAGLTQEAATLLEHFRRAPDETKSDILVRVLTPLRAPTLPPTTKVLELGQGAQLYEGEEILLFLSEEAKRGRKPHAVGTVRGGSLFMDGKKVEPSNRSVLQPAMHAVQSKLNHRNERGEIISLSAWRQWHVVRSGRLMSMVELKDPSLARKRGRTFSLETDKAAEKLGL